MGASEDPSSLFRTEAIEERRNAWLGQPTLVQPIPLRLSALVIALCAIATLAFLFTGSYSKRSRLVGTVASSSGVLRVHAPADGRLQLAGIAEGDRVAAGQALFSLDVSALTEVGSTGEVLAERLREQRDQVAAQIEFVAAEETMRRRRLGRLLEVQRSMVRALDERIESTDSYAALLQSEQDRFIRARAEGVVVQQEVDDRRTRLVTEQNRRDDLRLQLSEWMMRTDETELQIDSAGYTSAARLSDLNKELAELDASIAEAASQNSIELVSQIDGTVTALSATEGQMILAHAPVVTVVPDAGRLEVHFDASDTAVAHVREGDEVLLRYAAFPHQQYGQYRGVVESVTQAPVVDAGTGDEADAPVNLYRVVVVPEIDHVGLDGERFDLQIGMTVEADVNLESRRLYEWIIGPLRGMANSASGKVTDA